MTESGNENDKTSPAPSLWCRLIDGVELSNEENTAIRKALKSDDRLRKECDTDATIHALLRSVHDVKQSEEDFVRAVMVRCETESSEPVGPAGAEDAVLPELASVAVALPHFANVVSSSPTDHRLRPPLRSSTGWTSITVTAMLFVSMGLLGWWLASYRSTENGNGLVDSPAAPPPGPLKDSAGTVTSPSRESSAHDKRTSVVQMVPDSGEVVMPTTRNPETAPVNSRDKAPETEVAVDKSRSSDNAPESMTDGNAAEVAKNEVAKKEVALPGSTFVTLTKIEDPVWERSWVEGDRIGDDVVRLFGGRLELSFDDGAKVTLEGPIEFRPMTSGQLQLRRGRLVAAVPKEAIGFTVTTPTSHVVDLGTEFEVSVKETGASDVVVTKGEIEVMPAVAKGEAPRKWRLVPTGLNQASFFERTGKEETSPVSAAIRGADGTFQGMISINGQAAEFASAEAFDDVRERVMQQFEKSQQETLQQWPEFVESIRRNMQGTMQLNGEQIQFGSFEDMMKLQQQMMERMQIPGGAPVNFPESSFSGSISINGKVITFKTREEYEAARRSAFGPAANFGAGDFLERRKPTTRESTKPRRP